MKSHIINEQYNFIGGWYISPKICDMLIDYHTQSNTKHEGKMILENKSIVDKYRKNSIDCFLNQDSLVYIWYRNLLDDVLQKYIKLYPFCDRYSPFDVVENINIQKYSPGGGFYEWHTERDSENYPSCSRHLVFMTYLNDVNDAGETEFYHQNLKIKPEKGLTLIWPADWTFTHRGVPSMTEDKYIITGWINFIQ
jgi:hypothetical protein